MAREFSTPYREAQDAIARAQHLDDPRNPPNAAGQLANAKAVLALAFEVWRLREALTRPKVDPEEAERR